MAAVSEDGGSDGGSIISHNSVGLSRIMLLGRTSPVVAALPSDREIELSFRRQWPLLGLNFAVSDVQDGLGPLFNIYGQIRAGMSISVRC